MSTFGERMREARMDINLSQHALALMLGTSLTTVRAWELELRKPTETTMRAVAADLGVSFRWLNSGQGEKHKADEPETEDRWIINTISAKEKETLVRFLKLDKFDRRNIRNMVNRNIEKIENRHKEEGR